MPDKNTEYVNAQFDDAEERIEDLFNEISKEDTPAKTNEVAVTYCYMTWGWFHNSNIVFYTAYKSKGKVRMIAFTALWARSQGYGSGRTVSVPAGKEWGIPPKEYSGASSGGSTMTVSPADGGVYISNYNNANDPDPSIVITTSWDY